MSQMSLRLPDSLHAAVKEMAEKDHVSANQFITTAIAEKIAALTTADLLQERAARAPKRSRYLELLRKAPDTVPDAQDQL